MNYSDPLVTNGILYAPVRDIIMSNEPVYGVNQYNPYDYRIGDMPLLNRTDKFTSNNKKISSWKKLLFWTGAVALAVVGLKKYGLHPVKNFLKKHPKFANIGKTISGAYNTAVNFCRNHLPFIKKKP